MDRNRSHLNDGRGRRHRALALAAGFALVASANVAAAASTTRVSVDDAGIEADGSSYYPAIDRSGRYVAFTSEATNLVVGQTSAVQGLFVRDRSRGLTTLASVDSAGTPGNAASAFPSFAQGGRLVSFESGASNLVTGDDNDQGDIFVHDRKSGATTRVSVDSAGHEANGGSHFASMSSSGRYVAFLSDATNLVSGDTNGAPDVFVHDRKTGETSRVSVNRAGTEGNQGSILANNGAISASGRLIPFQSSANNLVAGDTNGVLDVFMHDRKTGETTRASVDSAGNEGNAASAEATTCDNGRFVAFVSLATNLVPGDTNGELDVFVHDLKTGKTERISVDSAGVQANGGSESPTMSSNCRYVSFLSAASNLVPNDTNGTFDIFVHDRKTGETKRVTVDGAGGQANGGTLYSDISGNGRFVAFGSGATNLVPSDVNEAEDVFVRDLKK